ncbi:aspartate racemase [Inhella inkyongensis]|uniref:Aspartate racemase n=1 Tax=Inhella inkyongensis TaxID=392593 RepID=A0A840S8B2_9BURK|nr:aspartate/glutamate racemase family protein [Inhella inkyongensis]MBB5205738.1 aspartate racemase [Inhella inkyongensis]
MSRMLGMLGGMSWVSTAQLYAQINQGVAEARGGLHSARLLIHSVDFAPLAAAQAGGDWAGIAQALGEAGAGLRRAGAEALILATNTMHAVADDIEQRAGLPLLHLVDITAQSLSERGMERVGLLGTRFTMELPFYGERLQRHGMTVRVPGPSGREAVHRAIYEELCHGRVSPQTTALLQAQVEHLAEAGAQAVVLGCTELMLALPPDTPAALPLLDSTSLQAQAAVRWLLADDPRNPVPTARSGAVAQSAP